MAALELGSTLYGLAGDRVQSSERLGGGRNSQVYRLTGQGGRRYVAKLYFRSNTEERDRLEAEYSGLSFLWKNGERAVPKPIAVDRETRCALYEYIEGTNISSDSLNESDIDQLAGFAVRLKGMARCRGSIALPLAAESCFTGDAIVANIKVRLDGLRPADGLYPELGKFLKEEFSPTLEEVVEWSRTFVSVHGLGSSTVVAMDQRTLSPSDFGFHNAIKKPDGRIVFLDFEHFGWDDPAKMVSDFLLHPAMDLSEAHKRRFLTGVLDRFHSGPTLARRIEAVYPLFGLKWCMILLNEFLPDQLARREFASAEALDQSELQAAQLRKARRMLQKVKDEYDCFPYRS